MKIWKSLAIMTGVVTLGLSLTTLTAHAKTYNYTRYDMEQMLKHKDDARYQMPHFPKNKIKNIPAAKDNFEKGSDGAPMDVWDSWPVKTASGQVANIHGYHVVFALSGDPKQTNNRLMGRICVYYQAIRDRHKGLDSWHYAGPLFNSKFEGATNHHDLALSHETGEWSGSALQEKSGKIRLLYTSFSGSKEFGGLGNNRQTLATAQVVLKKAAHGLTVDHKAASDRRSLFQGDNHYYETVNDTTDKTGFNHDDHTLRDPQIFVANGHKYVLFEGNTAKGAGGSGPKTLKENRYYGGSKKFQKQQRQLLKKNPKIKTYTGKYISLKESAYFANGCLGLLELNNDYKIKRVLPPLAAFHLVDDETERPSILKHDGRWYIFTAMHGWHMASQKAGTNDSFMLGLSSKKLTSGYRPLNKYGLVAYSDQNIKSRDFTYSYSMNQTKGNPYLLTSYITQLGIHNNGWRASFAPTVQIDLHGQTTKVNKTPLQQGQIVK